MDYNEFLFTHLLAAYNKIPKDCTYDMLYETYALKWYTDFANNEFDDSYKPLYECLEQYIQNTEFTIKD